MGLRLDRGFIPEDAEKSNKKKSTVKQHGWDCVFECSASLGQTKDTKLPTVLFYGAFPCIGAFTYSGEVCCVRSPAALRLWSDSYSLPEEPAG